jgi:hypothetical protein
MLAYITKEQRAFSGIIKIVQLPFMRVVSFNQKDSEIPERDAWSNY